MYLFVALETGDRGENGPPGRPGQHGGPGDQGRQGVVGKHGETGDSYIESYKLVSTSLFVPHVQLLQAKHYVLVSYDLTLVV